ncbi:OmpA family protein [Pseudomonas oryziphila]|uniref:OmpA family protein n=1 Tax=Pseudomonas oryziphila TaxID=2894079 RepID=A0ABN5THY2_9PSED|nr:OmpA family protein [Pseudomonas oryziphila]AZL74738.1 OmpA family protein [Pseudomonas oryziphila]
MSKAYLLPAMSLLGLMLAGCGTTPENPALLVAREAYSVLQGKPEASRLAALETQDAYAALGKAELASLKDRKSAEVERLATLAARQIEFAEQTIDLRNTDAALKRVELERTQARLDARTAQLNALKAKPSVRGDVVTFGDVLFQTGMAELNGRSQHNIQELAAYLQANPERNVLVEGFTDATGSDALNQRLSEQRADAVANALRRQGVAAQRIKSAGYGKDYPVASNATAQSRQLNRRVEVVISRGAEAVAPRF